MKKRLSIILVGIMCFGFCGCGTDAVVKDAKDQVANVIQAEDENVLSVKNGTNSNYPDVTYGEAFEEYFGTPTWKYFKGTQDGPDDDGDGEPDYTKDDIDVVEFTGYCMYSDVEVKALIQFTLDRDAGTFDATYLSFNEVPQSSLTLSALISNVFESYMEEHGKTEDNHTEQSEGNNDGDDVANEEVVYPEGMNYYKDEIDPMTIAGSYGGALGQSTADVSIYSSPEDTTTGNATLYLDSEIENYGGNEYSGELTRLDANVYSLGNDDNQSILLAINYDEGNDTISFELWIDNKFVENYYMMEHYES